jgi:hypothetical protein
MVVAKVESVMVIVLLLVIVPVPPVFTSMPEICASLPAIAPALVTELLLSIVTAAPPPTLTLPPLTIVTSPALDVETGAFCEAEMLVCARTSALMDNINEVTINDVKPRSSPDAHTLMRVSSH